MTCTRKANAAITFLEYAKSGEHIPNNATAYGKYFLLSDMAAKTCHFAAFSSLFYHTSDFHTILPWLEYDPTTSQQCTALKFEAEATSEEIFLSYNFTLGPSIHSGAFVNGTSCLLLVWHSEKNA